MSASKTLSQPQSAENALSTSTIGNLADRTTRLVVGAILVAVIVLIGLVAALTLIPAQILSRTISQQVTTQQEQITGSLSRQIEAFFNATANDLLSLTEHSEVQSDAPDQFSIGEILIGKMGSKSNGTVKAVVRLAGDGSPIYGWPDTVNQRIAAKQPLDWRIDAGVMQPIIQNGGVQLVKRSGSSGLAYLLIVPMRASSGQTEALALPKWNLTTYLTQNFAALKLSETTQVWVFDPNGPQVVYQRAPTPAWTGTDYSFFDAQDVTTRLGFPVDGRDAVIAPIFTAFTQSRAGKPSLVMMLNRSSSEGQAVVYDTLTKLFLAGIAVVILIVVLGLAIGRFVVLEANRKRMESQRRATVRTLLEMSRALNSSLDLPVVLNKILDELATLLPYNSASVMMIDNDPDEPTVTVAAQRGFEAELERESVPLRKVRGTREVVRSGKAVTINDTKNDPRWNTTVGAASIAAWMGVPLRIRDEAIGVLNINSSQLNRFGGEDAELAEAFADQACVAIENARAHEFQIRQYKSELETAHAIQTSLLPTEVPPMPQVQIASQSFPARHVSGDYYQYFALPDGRLGVAVGDVSGKGIPAALLMAVITTALREEVLRHPSAAPLLNQLNMNLLDRMQSNHMNSALLIAIFDPLTRHVELANAGMVQPYVRTASGWEFVPISGYPLGASARGDYTSKTLMLAPGAMLLLISDGVVEAQNSTGEFFGFERLEALLNGLPLSMTSNALVDKVLEAVREHLHGLEAQDDITVVAIKSVEV